MHVIIKIHTVLQVRYKYIKIIKIRLFYTNCSTNATVHNTLFVILDFKASVHLRFSSLRTFECSIFQMTLFPLCFLCSNRCLNTVCFSIVRCSLIRVPIVLLVSPMYAAPHVEHLISYTAFFVRQQPGLVDNLHVSQLRGQSCLFFGGVKTLDNNLPFMNCILTLFKRDLFMTESALLLYSSLINVSLR